MGTVGTARLTVSEYASRLGHAVREVGPAVVEGEVQRPKLSGSQMLWFSLTDGDAVLSCKVFRSQAHTLEHQPREGDLVQVEVERPDLWQQAGKLDLIVRQVRLAGEGELLRRRQELIARLTTEGLCDPTRRRPRPRFPSAVGVIAGKNSDATADVVRALTDRWPAVHIVTCASAVQGKTAPRQLIGALIHLQSHPKVDVIIVARGGGSVQDLACFDDEGLCRALFACAVPVVCAIGHTDNNPVCNHVTWPAYTPSHSAELVVPSAVDIRRDLAVARERLNAVPSRVNHMVERLHAAARLDCPVALSARAVAMHGQAAEIQRVLQDFLSAQTHGLEVARGIIVAVPHRAAREHAIKREAMPVLAAALASAGDRVTGLMREVRDQAERVRVATHRQLADHTRDYGRAFARLMRDVRAGCDRRAVRGRELLEHQGELLADCARRRLQNARGNTAHTAALVAARDFRRRGWLLASVAGAAVRSTADLQVGQCVDLELHDGRAQAIIENVNPTRENSHE
jgi:exodeoxyribonuclease VII large subunit